MASSAKEVLRGLSVDDNNALSAAGAKLLKAMRAAREGGVAYAHVNLLTGDVTPEDDPPPARRKASASRV